MAVDHVRFARERDVGEIEGDVLVVARVVRKELGVARFGEFVLSPTRGDHSLGKLRPRLPLPP